VTSLTDNFDSGTAGDDIATRSGWLVAGENYDVRVSDAKGVYGTNSPSGSGRGGAMFDTGSGDHYAELEMSILSNNRIGPAVRIVDKDNWLGVYLGGFGSGGLRSYEKIGGTIAQLTAEQGIAGNVYRLRVTDNGDGTSDFEMLENGVLMPDGAQSVSNADFPTTATNAGIMNDGTNVASSNTYWDNFDGGSIGGGGGGRVMGGLAGKGGLAGAGGIAGIGGGLAG